MYHSLSYNPIIPIYFVLLSSGLKQYLHLQGYLSEMMFYDFRSYAEALVSSDDSSKSAAASLRTDGPELPRQVLESLFHIPKNSEEDPSIMNWRNVVKQMESFAQKRVQLGPSSFIARELSTQGKLLAMLYLLFEYWNPWCLYFLFGVGDGLVMVYPTPLVVFLSIFVLFCHLRPCLLLSFSLTVT